MLAHTEMTNTRREKTVARNCATPHKSGAPAPRKFIRQEMHTLAHHPTAEPHAQRSAVAAIGPNRHRAPHDYVEYLARDFQLSVEHFPASLNRGVEAQKDNAPSHSCDRHYLGATLSSVAGRALLALYTHIRSSLSVVTHAGILLRTPNKQPPYPTPRPRHPRWAPRVGSSLPDCAFVRGRATLLL